MISELEELILEHSTNNTGGDNQYPEDGDIVVDGFEEVEEEGNFFANLFDKDPLIGFIVMCILLGFVVYLFRR